MTRGLFVVLEGPEGSGKSTLAKALAARLQAAGVPVDALREPGSTPVAEALRHEILHAERDWTAGRELLYFVTARADHVSKVILPALTAGRTVICDRYELSTMAYQGAGRGLPLDMVTWVNNQATGGLKPDLTIILDLSPEQGKRRQVDAGKRLDRLDRETADFHRRVAERYRAERGPGVVHLDGTLSPETLLDEAWNAVLAVRPALAPAGAR